MNSFLIRGARLLGVLIVLTALTSATLPPQKAVASHETYEVGDSTPTGGTVFYVLPPDTISSWHYLEVAPDNWNSGKLSNTSYNRAESYVYAYADKSWYIPSSDEFATLYSESRARRLKNITLRPGTYWTSTGVVANKQIQSLQAFNTATRTLTAFSYINAINGKVLLRVRPIRYFD